MTSCIGPLAAIQLLKPAEVLAQLADACACPLPPEAPLCDSAAAMMLLSHSAECSMADVLSGCLCCSAQRPPWQDQPPAGTKRPHNPPGLLLAVLITHAAICHSAVLVLLLHLRRCTMSLRSNGINPGPPASPQPFRIHAKLTVVKPAILLRRRLV